MNIEVNAQKNAAAMQAVALVQSNMVVGLGTGSTATYFVDALAKRVQDEKLQIICVPTSQETRIQAERLGINLVGANDVPQIDLTVDGADEIGPNLSLIKGGGGALLREKIVAQSSHDFVIIADHTKHVNVLGQFALPVEIIPFGWVATQRRIHECLQLQDLPQLSYVRQSTQGDVIKTESGNIILDLHLGAISDPTALANSLSMIAGVVEHGLFLNMAKLAFIAYPDRVERITQ